MHWGSGSNRTELEYPGANRIARENLLFSITCRRYGTLISARIILPARMRP